MYFNCKSYFSLRYGTFKAEELVEQAVEFRVKTLGLTNINSTSDLWDFVDFCQRVNIRPIGGSEIRNDYKFLYILLAKNNEGIEEINRFLSTHLQAKIAFPARHGFSKNVNIIYPLGWLDPTTLRKNEFIGVQVTEINKLFGTSVNQYPEKYVLRHPVTFANKRQYNVHRLLRAIDRNIILSKQDKSELAGIHETFTSPDELIAQFEQ